MTCKYMFKRITNNEIIPLPSQVTRLHDGVVLPKPDLSNDKYMRYLSWMGPDIWNSLPSEVRNERNYNKFVSLIKSEFKFRFNPDPFYKDEF